MPAARACGDLAGWGAALAPLGGSRSVYLQACMAATWARRSFYRCLMTPLSSLNIDASASKTSGVLPNLPAPRIHTAHPRQTDYKPKHGVVFLINDIGVLLLDINDVEAHAPRRCQADPVILQIVQGELDAARSIVVAEVRQESQFSVILFLRQRQRHSKRRQFGATRCGVARSEPDSCDEG